MINIKTIAAVLLTLAILVFILGGGAGLLGFGGVAGFDVFSDLFSVFGMGKTGNVIVSMELKSFDMITKTLNTGNIYADVTISGIDVNSVEISNNKIDLLQPANEITFGNFKGKMELNFDTSEIYLDGKFDALSTSNFKWVTKQTPVKTKFNLVNVNIENVTISKLRINNTVGTIDAKFGANIVELSNDYLEVSDFYGSLKFRNGVLKLNGNVTSVSISGSRGTTVIK